MLILLSPAKTLDFETTVPSFAQSMHQPSFLKQSKDLIKHLKELDSPQLAKLMKLSDKLAQLNVDRYQSWKGQGQRPALYTFKGDVYQGLAADTMTADLFAKAEKHLVILSGLYGLLHPATAIEAHRLEMGTSLSTKKGKNLYQFWDKRLTQKLKENLSQHKDPVVINLASQEYSKSVDFKALQANVITPVFKDEKNGKYKIISFYAKRARGLLARHLLECQLDQELSVQAQNEIKGLLSFTSEGYRYDPTGSTPTAPLFIRSEADRT